MIEAQNFLGLPEDILMVIFEEWLHSWASILAFDTALCNKSLRYVFHSAWRSRRSRIKWTVCDEKVLNYLKNRKIEPSAISADFATLPFDDLPLVDKSKVEALRLSLGYRKDRVFADNIIHQCSNLKHLEIMSLGYSGGVSISSGFTRTALKGLTELLVLKLGHLQSFNDEDLSAMTFAAPNLLSLTIFNCSCITAHGIIAATDQWKYLTSFSSSRVEPINFLPQFLPLPIADAPKEESTGSLKTLAMFDITVPNHYWQHFVEKYRSSLVHITLPHVHLLQGKLQIICQQLPLLEHLDLRACVYFNAREALQTLSRCRHLKHLHLNAVNVDPADYNGPLRDTIAWKEFVQAVPKLQYINMGNVIKLTDESVVILLQAYVDQLTYLAILKTHHVTDWSLAALVPHPNHCHEIKKKQINSPRLVVSEALMISEHVLRLIHNCTKWFVVSDLLGVEN